MKNSDFFNEIKTEQVKFFLKFEPIILYRSELIRRTINQFAVALVYLFSSANNGPAILQQLYFCQFSQMPI